LKLYSKMASRIINLCRAHSPYTILKNFKNLLLYQFYLYNPQKA
jgi:hypothetical protein